MEQIHMAKDEKAAETKGKKKKKPMLLIIILAAAVVLLGGGGFFAWKMMSGKSAPAAQGGQGTESSAKESHAQGKSGGHGGEGQAAEIGGATITLEPFLVNLADKDANRYLKTTIRILVTTEIVAKEINESDVMMPRIRDHILSILSNKMAVEITTNEGKQQLKKEIVEKVNEFLPDKCAKEVFFTDFVVQL
jgi:flagellar FliL protein